jgi:hypothetical protein
VVDKKAETMKLCYAKTKLVQRAADTIPRAEVFSAVDLHKKVDVVSNELGTTVSVLDMFLCTNSQVILAWKQGSNPIKNQFTNSRVEML